MFLFVDSKYSYNKYMGVKVYGSLLITRHYDYRIVWSGVGRYSQYVSLFCVTINKKIRFEKCLKMMKVNYMY